MPNLFQEKTVFLINAIKALQAANGQFPANLDELDNEPNEKWRDALISIEDSVETALYQLESYCNSNDIETDLFY